MVREAHKRTRTVLPRTGPFPGQLAPFINLTPDPSGILSEPQALKPDVESTCYGPVVSSGDESLWSWRSACTRACRLRNGSARIGPDRIPWVASPSGGTVRLPLPDFPGAAHEPGGRHGRAHLPERGPHGPHCIRPATVSGTAGTLTSHDALETGDRIAADYELQCRPRAHTSLE